MIIGKVVGSVISTRKNENLVGNKFLIIEPIQSMAHAGDRLVAIDHVGAGIGEVVMFIAMSHQSGLRPLASATLSIKILAGIPL